MPFRHLLLLSTLTVMTISTPGLTALAEDPKSAVIVIPEPRTANLLHLRGLAGTGTAYFVMNHGCSSLPVRFVAGDFNGLDAEMQQHDEIRLLVDKSSALAALYRGEDVVSGTPTIHVDRGLTPETGFVINTGDGLIDDIFGVRPSPIACPEDLPLT